MYRIGEFSYLFELSVKTLRHYDTIDLFKPSYKDPFTGYRYYTEEQRKELENILKLREYGFTLKEIKQFKKELPEEKIIEKIQHLESEQKKLDVKIKKLENLEGVKRMKYKVVFDSHDRIEVIGKRINVLKRDDEIIEKYFNELELKMKKMNLDTSMRVIITEEVGYKEDDVQLFIGYRFHIHAYGQKKKRKVPSLVKKYNLEWYGDPTGDYLVAIHVEKNDVITACKNIIEYSQKNQVQILGPFVEIYDDREDTLSIYVFVHDLVREEIDDIKIKEVDLRRYNEPFVSNHPIEGTWEIKEILPNIYFDPNKQKSCPNTKFTNLELKEDGTTNFENVTWSKDHLFIKTEHGVIANYMELNEIDDIEYLEIRMNDMSLLYPNAKPYSYIYVRKNEK